MNGHTPWPPGKPYADIQVNKREVFRFGDWSIYDTTGMEEVAIARWTSFILHCRTWKEWKSVARPPANTYVKGETVDNFDKGYQIQVTERCNANMTAETSSRCPDCRARIPNEVVALWKLQNMEQIQEMNSV